jgi:hypothetical protein
MKQELATSTSHATGAALAFAIALAFVGSVAVFAARSSGDWLTLLWTMPGVLATSGIVSAWTYAMIWGEAAQRGTEARAARSGNLTRVRVPTLASPREQVA